ncbi:alkane 1-monooxygenase [Rehaibacterium terrae]|jgi:alkane 1-monooxygenase|uniref:Alkane 1-monooxygenase n=1 Tax=Rehaibacterium terrae TaxID=1341696 RepID=A0A7W7Y0H6_9GAMM|nr:alkane 1-monooxygenase [Rehaibacterium terrae]MBB5015643.1 alkane 1-monooxygenase [Rehaibacterium terrae]
MPRWKSLGFLLVFVVPALMPAAAWLGVATGAPDAAAWFPLLFLFVLLPLADYAIGHDPRNPDAAQMAALENSLWFRALPLLALPVQAWLLAWSGRHFVEADYGPIGAAGWLLSQGVVGGVLLTTVGYHGFKIEHVRGHHVHVATPADASSARLGQSLWHFLPRALWRNTVNAWRLEAARLRRRGLPWWHWRNELIGWTALWLALTGTFAWSLGGAGLLFFLAQGLFAACSLEVINYVEHYGLERRRLPDGRYERPTRLHSWNSDYALSNLLLFQLQRHSDHHETPRRRYPALLHHPESPQLPGGYAAMFVLALLPPLWFRVIDPRVRTFRDTPASV